MTKAVPPPIQTVLELFGTSLSEVRFADIDGPTLARSAAEVEVAADALAAAQATLDAAREALQEKQDTLLQQAQRAVAYARVYAEGDEALSAELDAIALPRVRRGRGEEALILAAEPAAPGRPRGRPRKVPLVEGLEPSPGALPVAAALD